MQFETDPETAATSQKVFQCKKLNWRLSPGPGLWIFMSWVAHGAELRHKEVIAAMIGRRVLLNVGELHKLRRWKRKRWLIHSPVKHHANDQWHQATTNKKHWVSFLPFYSFLNLRSKARHWIYPQVIALCVIRQLKPELEQMNPDIWHFVMSKPQSQSEKLSAETSDKEMTSTQKIQMRRMKKKKSCLSSWSLVITE